MAPNPELFEALEKLKGAVSQLPTSTPLGPSGGIVGRCFDAKRFNDAGGTVWERIDSAYTRCFAKIPDSNPDPKNNVLSGPFGMDVVLNLFETVIEHPDLKRQDVFLLGLKINQLTDLVYTRIKSLPLDDSALSRAKKTRQHQHGPRAATQHAPSAKSRKNKRDAGHSEEDGDYIPAADPSQTSAIDHSESDSQATNGTKTVVPSAPIKIKLGDGTTIEQPNRKRKGSPKLNKKQPAKKKRVSSGNHQVIASPSGSDADDESDAHAIKAKINAPKKAWALSHYTEPVAGINPTTGRKVWVFYCRYCRAIRRISRSDGCHDFSEETTAYQASNFTSHLYKCDAMPVHEKWDAVEARMNDNKPPTAPDHQSTLSVMFAPPTETTHAQVQHKQVALRTSTFRSRLIQGVIRDNYPLTFGEGPGMISVFDLVNPHIMLPSHQTMRRDLDDLFDVLSKRLRKVMKAQTSHMAIASDAWSSKSSVYTFAGIIVSFIDDSWSLHQFPIDLVHLDAEHSGASVGGRVFKAIDHCGVAESLIASVTDNASANHTMNEEIARRFTARFGQDLNVRTMTVTCVAHAVHLICSAILSNLGVMESLEDDEAYAEAKAFDPGEMYENNKDTLKEQERLEKELGGEDEDVPPDSPDDFGGLSESESEAGPMQGTRGAATDGSGNTTGSQAKKTRRSPKKILNVLEKIHAIAVHCTSSPARRKRMRKFVRNLCKELKVMIKSMRIRWNSVLAEIRRALLLKPAVNQWVLMLDEGLTGRDQELARARKAQWTITDPEWDVLTLLVKLLEPFERASLSFSKQNVESCLPAVLPTYASLLDLLDSTLKQLELKHANDSFNIIKTAVLLGRDKLIKYIKIAQKSDLTLLALMLHPGLRLTSFSDVAIWDDVARRGRVLLEHLYDVYVTDYAERVQDSAELGNNSQAPEEGTWTDYLITRLSDGHQTRFTEEIRDYFANKYPWKKGTNLLDWWKEHSEHLPVMSRVAHDILCIPASSVSVERLFSQCRLVMTDNRIMSTETARRVVTCQHWLKAGLGANLPDFIAAK